MFGWETLVRRCTFVRQRPLRFFTREEKAGRNSRYGQKANTESADIPSLVTVQHALLGFEFTHGPCLSELKSFI